MKNDQSTKSLTYEKPIFFLVTLIVQLQIVQLLQTIWKNSSFKNLE